MDDEQAPGLGQAFMRAHPAQAARVLEALPVGEAAALFRHVPARIGALVLEAMLPRIAALNVAELDDPRALELLAAMHTTAAVGVLRHVAAPRRRLLLAGLPTTATLASALLLGYAEDSIGAWADPEVVALPLNTTAADVLERLRLAATSHALVIAVDAERRLCGVAPLLTLLRAPPAMRLSTLTQRASAVLAANGPLATAHAHPGWSQASTLPVVEPGDRLVGVLTHDALARALHHLAPPPADAGTPESLAVGAAQSYWRAASSLIEGALVALPRVPPLAGGRDGR